MRKNLYISIVGCGIAIAASYGCAKESLDTKTQSQAIVYENLGIGEGFDTREAADSKYTGTGNSCVLNNSVTFKDEPRDRSRISSFYSRDKVTLDNEIADLDVDVGFGEKDSVLSLGIDNTFVYAQDVAQEGVVLTFAATITTRTRGFDSLSELNLDGFDCDKGGALDADDFLDVCGTQYLAREDLGGVVLFAINLDTLTTEERTFFQNGTEFGILGATGNLGATVDLLKTVLTESREIFVWTHGFSSPPVGVNGDVITLKDRPKTARQS